MNEFVQKPFWNHFPVCYNPSVSPWTWVLLVFKARCYGGSPFRCRSWSCGAWREAWTLHSSERSSMFVSSLMIVCHWAGGSVTLSLVRLCPSLSYPLQYGRFPTCTICRSYSVSFWVFFFFLKRKFFHVQLQIQCVCGRRWLPDPPTLPPWTRTYNFYMEKYLRCFVKIFFKEWNYICNVLCCA